MLVLPFGNFSRQKLDLFLRFYSTYILRQLLSLQSIEHRHFLENRSSMRNFFAPIFCRRESQQARPVHFSTVCFQKVASPRLINSRLVGRFLSEEHYLMNKSPLMPQFQE